MGDGAMGELVRFGSVRRVMAREAVIGFRERDAGRLIAGLGRDG